jgi:hypothetical protein
MEFQDPQLSICSQCRGQGIIGVSCVHQNSANERKKGKLSV